MSPTVFRWVEVTNIDQFGFWLLACDKEYFLPYAEYPWFRNARIQEVLDVVLLHGQHLHWPALDVDLELEALAHPHDFPLIDKGHAPTSRRQRRARPTVTRRQQDIALPDVPRAAEICRGREVYRIEDAGKLLPSGI